MMGSGHPPLRSVVLLRHGVGAGKLSNHYNFGCMTASDSLFTVRSGFSGSSYPMKI